MPISLTPHFTLEEMTASETATKHGIDNTPTGRERENLQKLAEFMERVRSLLGCAINVNSAFRCAAVETIVSGKAYGQHMRGEACDFLPAGMSLKDAYSLIRNSNLPYDQLICEKPNKEWGGWLHVSIATDRIARRMPLVWGYWTMRDGTMKYLSPDEAPIP